MLSSNELTIVYLVVRTHEVATVVGTLIVRGVHIVECHSSKQLVVGAADVRSGSGQLLKTEFNR